MKRKLKEKWFNPDTDALFEAILVLKNSAEARRFFRDLLTEPEIIEFGKRWRAARMLARQERYTDIERITGLSSTTVARVQKWLQGKLGGYRLVIRRLGT